MNILLLKDPPIFFRNVKFVEVGLEMRKTLMIMKVPRVNQHDILMTGGLEGLKITGQFNDKNPIKNRIEAEK